MAGLPNQESGSCFSVISMNSFSLAQLIGSILNPVPLARTVLTIMEYEDEVEKLRFENYDLKESLSMSAKDLLRLEEQIHTLKLELEVSKERCNINKREFHQHKQVITRLQSALDESYKKQKKLMHEGNREVMVFEEQLEQNQDLMDRVKQSRDKYMIKYQDATEQILKLKYDVLRLEDVAADAEISKRESAEEIMCLQYKVGKIQGLFTKKCEEFNHAQQYVVDLTQQVNKMQVDVTSAQDRIVFCENTVEYCSEENDLLQNELLKSQNEVQKYASDFECYRGTHLYPDEIVKHLNEQVYSLQFKLEEDNAELSLKNKEIQQLQNCLEEERQQINRNSRSFPI